MRMALKKIISIIAIFSILSIYLPLVSFATNDTESLNIPSNLRWKEDSTATALWDEVENANYYLVNVNVYDENDELIGSKETGTTNNQLDLQQEINKIIENSNYEEVKAKFNVKAQNIDDKNNITIESDVSEYSDIKTLNLAPKINLKKPTGVTLNDEKILTWSYDENAYEYVLDYKIEYDDIVKTGYAYFFWAKDVKSENGIVSQDVTKALKNAYVNAGLSNVQVEISFKVMAKAYFDSNYLDSQYSNYSNSITYIDDGKMQLEKPVGVTLNDEKVLTWSYNQNAYEYTLDYKIEYENNVKTGYAYFFWAKDVKSKNGIVSQDVTNALKNAYTNAGFAGEEVEISFRIKAKAYFDSNYLDSEYSNYSNSITYAYDGKIQLEKPVGVTLNDENILTWSYNQNAYEYTLDYKIKYEDIVKTGYAYFFWAKDVKNENGIISQDITNGLKNAYTNAGFAGETVEISFRIKAKAYFDSNYLDSEYSNYSNSIYYNPNGSTIINYITLSPTKAIIGVGRSMYIGKTIDPADAYYSSINWTTSDASIVSVNPIGKITGIKKGNALVTAQINNTIQDLDVSVYEIETNIENNEDKNEVIEEANTVIEAVIKDGDVTNTDILDKEKVLDEIEKCADEGKSFNVDVTYEDKEKEEYESIKDKIEEEFKDFNIAIGNDIKIKLSYEDSEGIEHHIANITELKNQIHIKFKIPDNIYELISGKINEYKLIRYHNGEIEQIDFEINNDIVEADSDKFSDFILLYKENENIEENIEENEYKLGDVNQDGKVNSLDATLILKYVAKKKVLTEEQLKLADVTKDGKVNSLDAVKILKYVAKKITEF